VTSPYSINTVDLCPVGAHGQRLPLRLGHLVFEEHRLGVHDLRTRMQHADPVQEGSDLSHAPRTNLEVNGYWAAMKAA
jgi:hypothetical protein